MAASPLATAADYADAMMVARRAKNLLFLCLLLMLLMQLGVFFLLRYNPPFRDFLTQPASTQSAATQPAAHKGVLVINLLEDLTAAIDFLGIALTLVLSMVLLLLVKIMLVGRLIGVARVTSAYVWCIVLAVLLFPWQAFLRNPAVSPPPTTPTTVTAVLPDSPEAAPAPPNMDFKIPGVLYTWEEVTHRRFGATFDMGGSEGFLRWSRYVVFPVLAVVLLMMVQAKSSRGLRLALGEAEFTPAESPMG